MRPRVKWNTVLTISRCHATPQRALTRPDIFVREKVNHKRPDSCISRVVSGFTLVELVTTLVLLGVILGFGFSLADRTVWRLDASVSQVVQRARVARALAVLRHHDVILRIDQTKPAVVVHEDLNNDGTRDEGERVIRYPLEAGISYTRGAATPYAGFSGGAVSFTGSQVVFQPNGSCSEEGAVYVGRGVDDPHPRVVVFTRATGYTRVFQFTSGSWLAP